MLKNAVIGFLSSTASDVASNFFRVLKTIEQMKSIQGEGGVSMGSDAVNVESGYLSIMHDALMEGKLYGLMTRGLGSRVLSNGLQSVVFTIVWKSLSEQYSSVTNTISGNNTQDNSYVENINSSGNDLIETVRREAHTVTDENMHNAATNTDDSLPEDSQGNV